MKSRFALAFGLAVAFASSTRTASADPPRATVPIAIRVSEPFTLTGEGSVAGVHLSCAPPCTLELEPGLYRYTSRSRKHEVVALTGPSRLALDGPSEPLHTTGAILAGVGALTVVVPLVAMLHTCWYETSIVDGQRVTSTCQKLGGPGDIALGAVAGSGFLLAMTGAFLFLTTGGGLRVTDTPKSAQTGVFPALSRALLRGGTFAF